MVPTRCAAYVMERWQRAGREQAGSEIVAAVRDARFSHGLACARCGNRHVQRWGQARGRQRYRCVGCGRTFSDLTGTAAAYLKKAELLSGYAACLQESLSVRATASRLGIHPSTAFRWRHRLLAAMSQAHRTELSGWIEIDYDWFAHSRKGERGLVDRPPRRRAPRCLTTFGGRRVCVILACDRLGHVAAMPVSTPRIDADVLDNALTGRTDQSHRRVALTATRGGPYGPVARLARKKGWAFRQARGGAFGPLGWPGHVRTVVAYRMRLRRWLPRFRGVATKYLANYLSWHHALDTARRSGLEATIMRWPIGAGFG